MVDFVDQMKAERAALLRKVAGLDAALAAYGVSSGAEGAAPLVVRVRNETPVVRAPRNAAERVDKFGSYGMQVVEAVISYLPSVSSPPVPTREIVTALEQSGIAVRGENKVNALSALLARSSKIKGHGRSGWTLADAQTAPTLKTILGNDEAQNENEPTRESEVGSETAGLGAPTPAPAIGNPHSRW